ncbi:MAG: hypothetical protein ACK54C_14435, partial [Betaproteobacteria bacterium]
CGDDPGGRSRSCLAYTLASAILGCPQASFSSDNARKHEAADLMLVKFSGYLGVRDVQHDRGVGCGRCPACELRVAGWSRWRAAQGH